MTEETNVVLRTRAVEFSIALHQIQHLADKCGADAESPLKTAQRIYDFLTGADTKGEPVKEEAPKKKQKQEKSEAEPAQAPVAFAQPVQNPVAVAKTEEKVFDLAPVRAKATEVVAALGNEVLTEICKKFNVTFVKELTGGQFDAFIQACDERLKVKSAAPVDPLA